MSSKIFPQIICNGVFLFNIFNIVFVNWVTMLKKFRLQGGFFDIHSGHGKLQQNSYEEIFFTMRVFNLKWYIQNQKTHFKTTV